MLLYYNKRGDRMIEINAVVKVVPTEEAQAKIDEDLKVEQPTEEEARKIIARHIEKKEEDTED